MLSVTASLMPLAARENRCAIFGSCWQTLEHDTNCAVSWRARPGSFVSLMSLYESNYIRLAWLVPDLQRRRRARRFRASPATARCISRVDERCALYDDVAADVCVRRRRRAARAIRICRFAFITTRGSPKCRPARAGIATAARIAALAAGARARRPLAAQRDAEQVARLLRRARPPLPGPAAPLKPTPQSRHRVCAREHGHLQPTEQHPPAAARGPPARAGRAAAAIVLESRRAQEGADAAAGRASQAARADPQSGDCHGAREGARAGARRVSRQSRDRRARAGLLPAACGVAHGRRRESRASPGNCSSSRRIASSAGR